MSGKLGLAIFGAGNFMTDSHIPAILGDPTILLLAIWSRSAATGSKLAASLALKGVIVQTYHGEEGMKEVLEREDVKAVIVALPIPKQPEIVLKCLEAGKHVMAEKPVAMDVETALKTISIYETKYRPRGLIWRTAENWAHEPSLLHASTLLSSPLLGAILSYELRVAFYLPNGSKSHSTEWRSTPDYQGGFLLDGGVHFVAGLRVCLGDKKPTHVVAYTNLHRSHLVPHDTLVAIATTPSLSTPAHGPTWPQPTYAPQGVGSSSPSGTITITFGGPSIGPKEPAFYRFLCENGVVIVRTNGVGEDEVILQSTNDEVMSLLPGGRKGFEGRGVREEVEQFARAARGEGGVNRGEPRDSEWDLRFIQGCLMSQGKEVVLSELV